MLFRKPRSYSEVYNDLSQEIVNVFRVLRRNGDELRELLELTPFARSEFDLACEIDGDPIEEARRTIVRSFMGFGAWLHGGDNTGFRANGHKNGSTPAWDWSRYPSRIQAFTDRLRGVVIENRQAIEVISQQDSCDTLHYVDPPYVHDTRLNNKAVYAHEMTDEDHEELCRFLLTVKGMVVISGYDNEIYNDYLGKWHRSSQESFADGGRKRKEVLWMNGSWRPQLEIQLR